MNGKEYGKTKENSSINLISSLYGVIGFKDAEESEESQIIVSSLLIENSGKGIPRNDLKLVLDIPET